MAVFGKVLLYTLVMMGMLNVVNQAPLAPGFRAAFDLLAADHFLIFSSAITIALFNQKHLSFLLWGVTLLAAWPFDLHHLAADLTPFSAGILLGAATRRGIQELHGTTTTDTTTTDH